MRIRTIKPEWLDDELIVTASLAARVMSVSLILLADDYGNGRANTSLLGARIFPAGPHGIAESTLAELEAIKFVVLYEVDGQRYYSIRNWNKHQKVDKPGKPHVPQPHQVTPKAPRDRGEVAYFIRGEVTGLIKIGKSIDPVARLSELAKCSPEALHLLAVGGKERELHKRLAAHRVHGEWFKPHDEVIGAIREFGGNPDSPITSAFYENDKRRVVHANDSDSPEKVREDYANAPVVHATDQDQEGTRKGPGEEARVASRAFGWSDITETYSRLRSEAWERKTGNPGGRWKPGTKDHGGISSALELFRDEPDPQAALEDSIRGYLADSWAIERDWPFSAWARDPGRYRGKAPSKAPEQVTECNPALERFEAAKRRLDACKDPEQKGALLRDFYDAQHALARARVRGAA